MAKASSAIETAIHVGVSTFLEAELVDCDSLDDADAGDVVVSWELGVVVSWELDAVVSWEFSTAELEVVSLVELEIVDPEPLVSVRPDELDHVDVGIAPSSRYSTLEMRIPGISSQ